MADLFFESQGWPFGPQRLQALLAATGAQPRSVPEPGALVLGYTPAGLGLWRSGSKESPVVVDFIGGKAGHRRRFGGGKGQAIARAVGLNRGGRSLSVLDATGGLGRDAFVLASLGCQVTLVERSPVIAALLADGLERASLDADVRELAGRIRLMPDDALTVMASLAAQDQKVDVVYLDPMFPHRQKTALVKKEMRLFQTLVGEDADADSLLAPALALAHHRVVIKRPRTAPPLAGQAPTYQLEGKSCRYDIHALKGL